MSDAPSTTTIPIEETQSRKRRNRWGDAPAEPEPAAAAPLSVPVPVSAIATTTTTTTTTGTAAEDDAQKKPRKSRWAAAEPSSAVTELRASVAAAPSPSFSIPVLQPLSEEVIQQTVVLNLQLQQVNAKLLTVARDALIIEQDPNRSLSPPPKYDAHGKRMNTREVRMREALTQQRVSLIEQLVKLNPLYVPPADYVKQKPCRKIYFPKHASPDFNYIGLIIGPRGNTQKQMELETGCKISIRGKGSAKEGSKGRASKPPSPDDDDDLHVHIQGESLENVDKACKLIEAILRPVDETLNEHKQKQLRELALINGTLREDEYCPVCGEKGHRQFDCPYRAKAFKAAGVKCAICGDLSHPTRDCPRRELGPQNENALDSEYDSFLAELSGGNTGSGSGSNKASGAAAAKRSEAESKEPKELDPNGSSSAAASGGASASTRTGPIELPTLLPNTAMPAMPMYGGAYSMWNMPPAAPAVPGAVAGVPMVAPPVPPSPAVPLPPMPPAPPAPVDPSAAAAAVHYPQQYAGMCYPGAYADPNMAAYYSQYASYYAQQSQQSQQGGADPNAYPGQY